MPKSHNLIWFYLGFLVCFDKGRYGANAKFFYAGLPVLGGMFVTFYVGTKVMVNPPTPLIFFQSFGRILSTCLFLIIGLHLPHFVAYVPHWWCQAKKVQKWPVKESLCSHVADCQYVDFLGGQNPVSEILNDVDIANVIGLGEYFAFTLRTSVHYFVMRLGILVDSSSHSLLYRKEIGDDLPLKK